jgi:hypothetical protein
LNKWRAALPFEALIMNEYDGRTEAWLKKAIERLYDEKKKDKTKEGVHSHLSKFHMKVLLALELRKNSLASKDFPEALVVVQSALSKGIPLLLQTCIQLLEKHVDILKERQQFLVLAMTIIPIGSGADGFNPAKPDMKSLTSPLAEKVDLFLDPFAADVVKPLVARGLDGVAMLLEVLAYVHTTFEAVDLFTVESCLASAINMCDIVYNVAKGLSKKDVDPALVVALA